MTTLGYIADINYIKTDSDGFTTSAEKVRFYCLPMKKDKTMITDGKILFTLKGEPSQENLNEYFTKRFNSGEYKLNDIDLVRTIFAYETINRLDEMEAFRLKATKAQAKADNMFNEFQTLQQAFCLIF